MNQKRRSFSSGRLSRQGSRASARSGDEGSMDVETFTSYLEAYAQQALADERKV
jgi:hypothetical protein